MWGRGVCEEGREEIKKALEVRGDVLKKADENKKEKRKRVRRRKCDKEEKEG